jgi:hypothetical protein
MRRRLTLAFVAASALAGLMAFGVGASDAPPPVPVLAPTVDVSVAGNVPAGTVAVFLQTAGDGFSDGGDGPGGLEWGLASQLPDGFADGGDVPEGYVAFMAQPVGDEFWRHGVVPEGMLPVLAWQVPDGFADGGDLPEGWVPVLFPATEVRGLAP